MSSDPNLTISSFALSNITIPEAWKEANVILKRYLEHLNDTVVDREVSLYATTEVITGQKFYIDGNIQQPKETYRKVVECGALANTGTTNTAHGITIEANTIFTKIQGTAITPSTSYIPLPFIDTAGDYVKLDIDATNVNLTTSKDYSAYTKSFVILEYYRG